MAVEREDVEAVQVLINYRFNDVSILQEALRAPGCPLGVVGDPERMIPFGNKKLVHVGPNLVQFIIVKDWYPTGASTSEESQFGQLLTNEIFNAARAANMGHYMAHNPSQRGQTDSRKLLVGVVYAILAAVYFDSRSIEEVARVMDALHIPRFGRDYIPTQPLGRL